MEDIASQANARLREMVVFTAEKLMMAERANLEMQAALGQAMREAAAAKGEARELKAKLDALTADKPTSDAAPEASA